MMLQLSDLQSGDILLVQSTDNPLVMQHAAMVTRLCPEKDQCWVTHAIETYPGMVSETLLMGNTDHYSVWRCQNPFLAAKAAEWMRKWSLTHIPYGKARAEDVAQIEEHFHVAACPEKGLAQLLEAAKEAYSDNWFRILKYAARRETRLSNEQGFTPAGIVVIAWQIAEISSFFMDQDKAGITWITDKYSSDSHDKFIRSMTWRAFIELCQFREITVAA